MSTLRESDTDRKGLTLRLPVTHAVDYDPTRLRDLAQYACRDPRQVLSCLLQWIVPNPGPLADRLMERFDTVGAILSAGLSDLMSIPEMTLEVALYITQLHGAMSFAMLEKVRERPVISALSDLEPYLRFELGHRPVEELRVFLLDNRNRLLNEETVARGTYRSIPVRVRETVRLALSWNAAAVVLAHNHPSGDPSPSVQDVEFTRQIAQALSLIDITLHDHIIVGRDTLFSMKCNA